MNWLSTLVLLAGIAHAQSLCFGNNFTLEATSGSVDPTKEPLDLSAVTAFGLDLFRQLAPANSASNLCFSPFSIWSALTLTYFGSGGNTQKELEAALRVSDKPSAYRLLRHSERMPSTLQKNGTSTFNVANRIYFQSSLPLGQCVKDALSQELRSVNFRETEKVAKDINNYVSNVTRGNIPELVTPGDLHDALMALVNAAFFKGVWKFQFRPSLTSPRDFQTPSGNATLVAMMSQTGQFRHGVSSQLGASILELPYAGDHMSMFVLLPNTDKPLGDRFTHMVKNINNDTLMAAISHSNLKTKTVDILLPKFKFEMKIQEELIKALQTVGIADLFDRQKANLTGFSQPKELYASKAIHRAVVEVNEEGTVAAATTAIILTTKLGAVTPDFTEFYCEQPFAFFIRDNQTKAILFAGAVHDPTQLGG